MNKGGLFVTSMIRRFRDDEIPALASQLAYSLLLSLMPFLIFLLTIIGFTQIKSYEVLRYLNGIIPADALELIETTVIEVVDIKNTNLLSFSLLITIWAATGGIKAVIHCLNKAYDEREKRGFIKVQLLSIVFTVGLVLVIFSAIALLVFGNVLGNYISCCYHFSDFFRNLWDLFRYIIMVLVMIFIFAFIYHYTPSRRLTWHEVLPGALFCSGGWIIISIGFSFYVDNFANYSRLYGGIAAVFILMAWIYLSSLILLIGGEINATLAVDCKKCNIH